MVTGCRSARPTSASARRTNALEPISVAERSLAAGPRQWAGLAPSPSPRSPATRPRSTSSGANSGSARAGGARPALDPPRPELGDRVRALPVRDERRDRAHGGCGRLDARLLRPLGGAAPRASGRARAADRRERREPRRPCPPRPRDRLPRPRLLAGLQPRGHLHRARRRDPARGRSSRHRPPEPRGARSTSPRTAHGTPQDARAVRRQAAVRHERGVGSRRPRRNARALLSRGNPSRVGPCARSAAADATGRAETKRSPVNRDNCVLFVPGELAGPSGRGRAARPLPRRARGRLARGGRAARRGGRARRRRRARRRATASRAARARSSPPRRRRASSRARAAAASPTRTSTCWSSTSRPGVVVHPAPGTRPGRSSHGARRASSAGGEPGAARDRPPARPRHVGADGRRAVATRPTRGCSELRPRARARARVPRARPRPAALARGPDRGADRPRPRRPDAHVARHRRAARGGHALRGRARSLPSTRCCACGSRPGARTRSASTSPRSACRSSATPSTASPSSASAASSCTPRGSRSRTRSRASGSTSSSPLPPDLQAYLERLSA